MSCSGWEDDILLALSEELPAERARALDTHLRDCTACRAYRDEVQMLTSQTAAILEVGEPSPPVMQAIHEAARTRKRGRVIPFPSPVVRMAACAAALALAVSGWFSFSSYQQDVRLREIGTIVELLASEDGNETDSTETDDSYGIEDIARQLLEMEGLALDPDEDILTLLEQPDPTALRLRRTGASQA